MMFKIKGLINERNLLLHGRVYGDLEVLEKAEIENKKDRGNWGIPPRIKSTYLSDMRAAYFLITSFVFDKVISAEKDGSIPEAGDEW
ncbi:MAG: hypothetical protein LBB80_03540 [Treponema sp.]|nr:hypothetical protein [Treponema sp.]